MDRAEKSAYLTRMSWRSSARPSFPLHEVYGFHSEFNPIRERVHRIFVGFLVLLNIRFLQRYPSPFPSLLIECISEFEFCHFSPEIWETLRGERPTAVPPQSLHQRIFQDLTQALAFLL